MAAYWISYKLSEQPLPEGSYQDRYEAMISVLEDCIGNDQTFVHQTTSFYVFQSDQSIDYIAERLKAELNSSQDHFIIRKMNYRSARIFGKNLDPDIFKLMTWNGITYLKWV